MVRRLALVMLLARPALANDLIVDPRTLQMNDLTTITVSLEGSFAGAETVNVPLDNLAFVGEPWVSSEFAWINGEVVRRKVFRFRARPLLPGVARVGPLVLTASDGQRETLPMVAVHVMPDRIAVSNNPEVLLREITATGRPPLFLVAEADKNDVWLGEQVLVTWYLYIAVTVDNWQIVSVPKLPDFWSEEIDARANDTERVFVGDRTMQRLRLRRVALYPLRAGTLEVGGMSVEAAVMERVRSGPFAMFEGSLVETTFTSAPFVINVKPLPPGPAVAAVGELALTCFHPQQKSNGPVIVEATLKGSGNLRGADAPRFTAPVAGNVQIEEGSMSIFRGEGLIEISRTWRFLIFPEKAGPLETPAVTTTIFSPATGQRRELQCEATTLSSAGVPAADQEASRLGGGTPSDQPARTPALRWVAFGLLAVLFAGISVPRLRREIAIRRDVREIVRSREIRARVDALLGVDPSVLLKEQSDRGDAYRALRSLLDARERDRDIAADADREIARRVRDVLTIAR